MAGALELRGAEALNTENFCASFLLWQLGHSGSVEPITSFSKLAWHSSQTYSKIGMGVSPGRNLADLKNL